MGSRNYIQVNQAFGSPIYLYGHSSGELHETTAKAICRAAKEDRDRILDQSYMTRILFNQMQLDFGFRQDPQATLEGTIGFGIGTVQPESQYDPIIVTWSGNAMYVTLNTETFDAFNFMTRHLPLFDTEGNFISNSQVEEVTR